MQEREILVIFTSSCPLGGRRFFKQWIDWAKHVFALGLDYQDFAFYPFDEPDNSTEAGYLIEIAKLIKEVDPELQIYTTLGPGRAYQRD